MPADLLIKRSEMYAAQEGPLGRNLVDREGSQIKTGTKAPLAESRRLSAVALHV
jgi:hypothetical protein